MNPDSTADARPKLYRAFIACLLTISMTLPVVPAHAASSKGEHGGGKPAQGQHPEAGGKGGNDSTASAVATGIAVTLTALQARDYAVNSQATGYKPLPPGIAKNLQRGKPLPPGIAKRGIPADMQRQLPHYEGHEWRAVGRDLVLVAIGTLNVVEILNNVFD